MIPGIDSVHRGAAEAPQRHTAGTVYQVENDKCLAGATRDGERQMGLEMGERTRRTLGLA